MTARKKQESGVSGVAVRERSHQPQNTGTHDGDDCPTKISRDGHTPGEVTGTDMVAGSKLPPLREAWREAFARLVAEKHAEEPAYPTRSGCWCIRFDWIMSCHGTILALLPGSYERIREHWEEMCDCSGECVDFESESAVYACDAERAIFSFTEHWQGGLGGTVTVYPTDEAYMEAREWAMRPEDLVDDD